MKLKGQVIEANIVPAVIPRPVNDIVFQCQPVINTEEFDELCPMPKPRKIVKAGTTESVDDLNNVDYIKAMADYNDKYMNFLIFKSLEATEGLEWESVKLEDPETWGNIQTELKEAGLIDREINLILGAVMEANALDSAKIQNARDSFLASRQSPKA